MKTMLMSFFVLLCLFLTNLAFDYWQENVEDSQFTDVIALSNTSKVQTLTSPSGKKLVPQGTIMGTDDVNEVYCSYLVEVQEGNELNVFVDNVFITKDNKRLVDEIGVLSFDFEIEMINETQAAVYVTISLNMPANEEHYNLIKNTSLSFNLVFNQNPLL